MEKHVINVRKGKVIIVPVMDMEHYLPLIAEEDSAYLDRFSHIPRKAAGAAWRAALREELGRDINIGYDRVGAPTISGTTETCYISVSHSSRWAAIIISGCKCAIDIEDAGRNYSRAAAKFVSDTESALPGADNPLFLPAVWCAKEALYKISGRDGLELNEDLRITGVDLDEMSACGQIRATNGTWDEYHIALFVHHECLIACISC